MLPGNGDGSFRDRLDSPFAVPGQYVYAFGDLDGDDHLDIAIAALSAAATAAGVGVVVVPGDGFNVLFARCVK